jgi:RNA polymerase-binding transcription factor DksA
MGKSNKYSKKELKEFKEKIIAKKAEVLKDIINSKDIADNMLENSNTSGVIYSSHLADGGADQAEIEKAYYWVQRENKFLQYLDGALEMIDEGTFGICKKCNDRISAERLIEVPHTTNCFTCKNKK